MHIRRTVGTALVAATAMAALVAAQGMLNVKLGLWETTSQMDMGGAMPPGVDLSKLTPEQQQQVAAMMRGRGAGGMMAPTVSKVCMTKEKIEKGQLNPDRPGTKCENKITRHSATVMDISATCVATDGSNATSTADMHIEALSPTSTKMTAKVTGAMGRGRDGSAAAPTTVNFTMTGKWLAADCGDVK